MHTNQLQTIDQDMTPPLSNTERDVDFKLSYVIFQVYLSKELTVETPVVSPKVLKSFLVELERKHNNKLIKRSRIVVEMFLLHQIVLCLEEYNNDVLLISKNEFRAKVLFPNVLYILMRFFYKARDFIQKNIRVVYGEYQRKASGLIRKYENSYFFNKDIIHYDVKLSFLGNGIKKFNPLYLNNITVFYKQVFRNILFYYFKKEHNVHTELVSYFMLSDTSEDLKNVATGLSLYRDVLYELQIDKIYNYSPSFFQMKYNFNIFKNIIFNNEFQSVFLTKEKDISYLNNNQYKLTLVYDQDINGQLAAIKKLPTIYRLLKAVHVFSNTKPYNEAMVSSNSVKMAVMEELLHPFKNLFNQETIYDIIEQIAVNFTNSILSGEYINLVTLSPIKINQITFITQIKKFIRICLANPSAE